MHIKTIMSYRLTPVRAAIIRRQEINVGETVEKKKPLCTVGGSVNLCNYYGGS